MKRKIMKKTFFVGLFILTIAPAQAQPRYNVVDLGTLDGKYSIANAINNKGEIAGQVTDKDRRIRAVKWVDGKAIDCGVDGVTSTAMDINENGYMVGYTGQSFGVSSRAVYWTSENEFHELDLSDTWNEGGSALRAINEQNQVVGYAADKADDELAGELKGEPQGFRYNLNEQTIEPLQGEGINFLPNGINEAGDVVITLFYDGTKHGAMYPGKMPLEIKGDIELIDINDNGQIALCLEGGQALRLDVEGAQVGVESFGVGMPCRINNAGIMVGIGEGGANLFENRQAIRLNTLIPADSGWRLDQANDINDRGQIVGFGSYKGSGARAFLLNPIQD